MKKKSKGIVSKLISFAIVAAMGIGGISVPMNVMAEDHETAPQQVSDETAVGQSSSEDALSDAGAAYDVSSMTGYEGVSFIEVPDLVSQIDAQQGTSNYRTFQRYATQSSSSRKSGSCDYFYNQMNSAQKALYDALDAKAYAFLTGTENGLSFVSDGKTYYIMPGYINTSLSETDAATVARIFAIENPEYYFLDKSYAWQTVNGSLSITCGIYQNFVNGTTRKNATTQINNTVASYISEINKCSTTTDRERKAHDLIIKNTIYGQDKIYHQSAAGVFLENEAVCAGYSAAFQYLMDKIGIPCVTITSSSHAWNEVKIDGKWVLVDVTWDDPLSYSQTNTPLGSTANLQTTYFNKSKSDDVFKNSYFLSMHTPEEKYWKSYTRPIDNTASDNESDANNDNTDNNASENNNTPSDNTDTDDNTPTQTVTPSVNYEAHVQNIGWMKTAVKDGAVCGTTGKSLRVEALKISISGDSNLGISYQAHVQDIGWQTPVADGKQAGTTGQGKRVEALRINLTGSDASKYDVYYCIHSENYGWFNWVKNGETTGTSGLSYRVEAFAVKILPKGSAAPARLGSLTIGHVDSTTTLSYSAHVQNIGWMSPVSDGATAGTTGRSLQMEALKITKSGAAISGSVNYKAHVENIGWMNTVSDGAIAGTTGRSLRVEAVSISLSGGISEAFDVYYRVHVQNIGWTGWAVNGANCGSQGISKRIEAIEIKLVAKGKEAPGFTNNTFFKGFQSGIDVSKWQGDIDWSKASKAINFAIIRCNEHSGNNYAGTDPKYFQNMKGAKKYNVPVGVYYYSVATNTDEAVAEANLAVSLVQQAGGVSLPIFIDIEADNQKALTNDQRTAIVKAFCNRVQGAGYQAGVYTSYSWFADYKGGKALLNTAELTGYTIWCARYNASSCGLPYQYSFWQYSSQGSIPGIKANVDLDYRYF